VFLALELVFDLLQCPVLGLRTKEVEENTAERCNESVDGESGVGADGREHGGARLDHGEEDEESQARRRAAADAAHVGGEHLAGHHPRQRHQPHGHEAHVGNQQQHGRPRQKYVVPRGVREAEEGGQAEQAEAGAGGRDERQRPTAEPTQQHARQQRHEEARHVQHTHGHVLVHCAAAQRLLQDAHLQLGIIFNEVIINGNLNFFLKFSLLIISQTVTIRTIIEYWLQTGPDLDATNNDVITSKTAPILYYFSLSTNFQLTILHYQYLVLYFLQL